MFGNDNGGFSIRNENVEIKEDRAAEIALLLLREKGAIQAVNTIIEKGLSISGALQGQTLEHVRKISSEYPIEHGRLYKQEMEAMSGFFFAATPKHIKHMAADSAAHTKAMRSVNTQAQLFQDNLHLVHYVGSNQPMLQLISNTSQSIRNMISGSFVQPIPSPQPPQIAKKPEPTLEEAMEVLRKHMDKVER